MWCKSTCRFNRKNELVLVLVELDGTWHLLIDGILVALVAKVTGIHVLNVDGLTHRIILEHLAGARGDKLLLLVNAQHIQFVLVQLHNGLHSHDASGDR